MLLAKSYSRSRHGDTPPNYALLTQHSRDVAEACSALAQTIGDLALSNADLSDKLFPRFELELSMRVLARFARRLSRTRKTFH